ncbi:hypothetical protein BDV97DRAFT_371014 [Delphinella strobiligena]|nr:hypothetical protein BDV97DRAFT_371014 [Delphinella strobiligena]
MTAAAALYRGTCFPFRRGYNRRIASTGAHEMDRNLMFYYEHLQLYDPNQIRRGSNNGEGRSSTRWQAQQSRGQLEDVPQASLPQSPPQTPTEERGSVYDETPTEQREAVCDEAEDLTTPPDSQESSALPTPVEEGPAEHIGPEDLPPAYQLPNPPEYQTFNEDIDPMICHPELAENLRRFLLFCLAIDYDLVSECPEMPRQSDWLPFLRLARHWSWRESRRRYQQGYDPVRPAFLGNPSTADSAADDDRALKIEQCIFACVVRPAQALCIPPDIAITMLRDFPSSITSVGDYTPCWHRYRCPNTRSLATKLLLDREILFDTVTKRDHQGFRSALHEANERFANKNFVALRSPDDYELTQHGLMREKLERPSRPLSPAELDSDGDFAVKGRKRFSRWVRKLSST